MFGKYFELNDMTLNIVEQIGRHMPGGFFIYKAQAPEELLYANQAVFDIFGCSNLDEFKELTGYTFKGMLHPEDYRAISDSIVDQIDKSEDNMDYVVYRIIRRDGAVRWVDDYGHFTETEHYGGIYYVFISDITEKRERMETDKAVRQAVIEALSESYHTVWLISDVETGTFALYRGDVEDKTIHAEPIREALNRLTYPQAKDHYIMTTVAEIDQERLSRELTLENIARRLSEKPQFNVNYLRRLESGEERYFRIEFAKVDMPDGKMGVVCGFKDVDDEVREEQAVQRALREANEAKSNFLSNMSHEIRTPITAILGMNELIRRESKDAVVLDYAKNIDKAGTSLLGIINDILDFSKIEAGRMELVNSDYLLRDLIVDVVNLTRLRAEEKGLHFRVDFDPQLPSVLHGDELRIKQILTNLLSNAVKYTERGSVILSCEGTSGAAGTVEMTFSVTDTGIGIRKEDQDKLFSAFDRLDVMRTRSIEGTGLGLAITAKMLEMMESGLQVQSVYGEGSTFSFAIRQRIVDPSAVGRFDALGQDNSSAAKKDTAFFTAPDARILLVDDTPLNLQVIEGLLKRTRASIDTAGSGAECIAMFAHGEYDIVFLDYRMPQMDGIETLQRMKERFPEKVARTPVISLTASAVSGDREKMLSAGFNDYLSKPVNIAEMEAMMQRYLPPEKVQNVPVDDAAHALSDTAEGGDADWIAAELALLPKSLRTIPGLDTSAGIEYCGDAEEYMEALRTYLVSIPRKSAEIEEAVLSDDIEGYTTMVHSLKSTSRAVGAIRISEQALLLEQAARANAHERLRAETPLFLEQYRALEAVLNTVMKEFPT